MTSRPHRNGIDVVVVMISSPLIGGVLTRMPAAHVAGSAIASFPFLRYPGWCVFQLRQAIEQGEKLVARKFKAAADANRSQSIAIRFFVEPFS